MFFFGLFFCIKKANRSNFLQNASTFSEFSSWSFRFSIYCWPLLAWSTFLLSFWHQKFRISAYSSPVSLTFLYVPAFHKNKNWIMTLGDLISSLINLNFATWLNLTSMYNLIAFKKNSLTLLHLYTRFSASLITSAYVFLAENFSDNAACIFWSDSGFSIGALSSAKLWK